MSPHPAPMPVAAPFDRKLARRWLKEQIAQAPPILKQIKRLHRDARRSAMEARSDRTKRSRRDRLRSTPVANLLRKDANVNPCDLTGAGVFTADHILELGASGLRVRARIDANAASKWVDAARDVKRAREGDDTPPSRPEDWVEEDVNLVRALLVLESAELLRYASHTEGLAYPGDFARTLLRATNWLWWRLKAAQRAGVIESVTGLAEWVAAGNAAAHRPQVEQHLRGHLARADELRDQNEVARMWPHKHEDLLKLLKERVS